MIQEMGLQHLAHLTLNGTDTFWVVGFGAEKTKKGERTLSNNNHKAGYQTGSD